MNRKVFRQLLLYLSFAVISTWVNLGSQWMIKWFFMDIPLFQASWLPVKKLSNLFILQLFTGTITGFVVKFLLDKLFVFKDQFQALDHTIKQFLIYGFLAIFTTLIFWFFEISFKILFLYEHAELIGGFIGLVIGYIIKFILDKKFVFINAQS
ncbi:MAG: GtrA family protein [Spirochaetes bacterium]|nr:GtrA family protein [Spirochaetota bacterium]